MVRWLYRYIFRGIGILMLIGMLTLAYLAIRSQMSPKTETGPPTHMRKLPLVSPGHP